MYRILPIKKMKNIFALYTRSMIEKTTKVMDENNIPKELFITKLRMCSWS